MLSEAEAWSKRLTANQKIGILGLTWIGVFATAYFGQYLYIFIPNIGLGIYQSLVVATVVFATVLTRIVVDPDRHKKDEEMSYYCAYCNQSFKSLIRPKADELIQVECPNCHQRNLYGRKDTYTMKEVQETITEDRP